MIDGSAEGPSLRVVVQGDGMSMIKGGSVSKRTTSQIGITFGSASALVGLLTQTLENALGRQGDLQWMSTLTASAGAGWIVGRRGRGTFVVLAAAEAGLGVGAVDGALRATAMYPFEPTLRRETPLLVGLYVMAATLVMLGTICGGLPGLMAQGIVERKRS